jgi:hypothetical protein
MKTWTLLAGKVSHVSTYSSTEGSVSTSPGGGISGTVSTSHTTFFRVDGKPARFGAALNVADGDAVTLVGYDKAEFEAFALRNDSTGVVLYHSEGTWGGVRGIIFGGCVLLALYPCLQNDLGSPAVPFGIGAFIKYLTVALIGVFMVVWGARVIRRQRSTEQEVVSLLKTGKPR